MACWLQQPTSNKDLCDAIDAVMKPEHEDVILFDDPLSSGAPLDLDLDSISDLLENPSMTSGISTSIVSPMSPSSSSMTETNDYSQPLNIYDITPTTFSTNNNNNNNNNSQSNTMTSGYSSLGISPKFTTLSINQHHHPFSPPLQDSNNSSTLLQPFLQQSLNSKNNLHPPPFLQQQQDNSSLGATFPFELQVNNGPSDVKRFRSASMNEGATQYQQAKIDPHIFDPYRNRSHTYVTPPYYQGKTSSLTSTTATTTASSTSSISTDVSSNSAWPFVDDPRPTSISFSEVLNQQQQQQQQQLRINNNLSTSYGGSLSLYSLQEQRNSTGFVPNINFQSQQPTNCTLYSLNQPTNGATPSSPTRKRPSLVGFSVDDIKDNPNSPNGTIEQQSEADLWSDIEQNSSDRFQDNDLDGDGDELTSDDETTTISGNFNMDSKTTQPNPSYSNSSSLFWQYNVQAKGPKTKRILYLKERDPHLFREFSDPVYQIKLTQTQSGQTFTKLRKGDGNDVTPNPVKLYQLGKQIRDLSMSGKTNTNAPSVYHGIYHVDHQSNANDTAEVKKEKNKIASRACRLRKKAQHEANKLKLHGLNEEHKTLIDLIASIKLLILKRYHDGQLASPSSSPNQSLETAFEQLVAHKYNQPVAGNTDGFVQGIINDMEQMYATKQQRSLSSVT
ncbi:unnamed protein product [Adineta steineri]|uniref:BZIP domain-containing protein n=1 Tax=Adineta steineri TaxID=433720 RepID=A0A818I851_9BILA|nr:unnamed protein product [Adineta steineri]CAF3518115.1 unnamed protein product [Adineta steineri]